MQHSHFAGDVIEGPGERFHGVKKFKIQLSEINSAKSLIEIDVLWGLVSKEAVVQLPGEIFPGQKKLLSSVY